MYLGDILIKEQLIIEIVILKNWNIETLSKVLLR